MNENINENCCHDISLDASCAESLCSGMLKEYDLYCKLWDKYDKFSKIGSTVASGDFTVALIRKYLLNYLNKNIENDENINLFSGLVYDAACKSPQIDLMACSIKENDDAVVGAQGFVNIHRVRCVLEVKSISSSGAAGVEDNIKQVLHIKKYLKNTVPCGILWLFFCGSEEKLQMAKTLCEKNKISWACIAKSIRKSHIDSKRVFELKTDRQHKYWLLGQNMEYFLNWFINAVRR